MIAFPDPWPLLSFICSSQPTSLIITMDFTSLSIIHYNQIYSLYRARKFILKWGAVSRHSIIITANCTLWDIKNHTNRISINNQIDIRNYWFVRKPSFKCYELILIYMVTRYLKVNRIIKPYTKYTTITFHILNL